MRRAGEAGGAIITFRFGRGAVQTAALAERHVLAAEALGGWMPTCHPESLHLWINLPEAWPEVDFVTQARLMGVAVAPGNAFCATEKGRAQAVRISLGSTRADDLRRGLATIAGLLTDAPEALLPTI